MKLRIALFALMLLNIPATAQQAVQQSGSVTRGHVPYWVTSGVIGDGGSATNSSISSIGVTNNGGAGICVSSDVQTADGRNQLCFGASTTSSATISLQNYGTAAPQTLEFIVNGAVQGFPAVSPLPVVVNDLVCFASTGGLLKDCGFPLITASAPITLSGGGVVGCATCVTSSGGGAITGTNPVAVSAAGAISITGAAGQVLAGSGPAFTPTPILGVAGSTVGSLGFQNATTGTITLAPVTGALGSAAITLPAITDTLAGKALANGGTNAALTASNGGIVWSNASQLQILSGTATASQVLLSGSSATPAFSTATYPATASAGTMLNAGSSNAISATATPTLGIAGSVVGSAAFANATSGSITIQPSTGALGSSVLSLPIATDTLTGKATTDTLTNKTYNSQGTGNVFQIAGNTVTTVASLAALLSTPQVTVQAANTSGTYSVPANTRYLIVDLQGGGSGGGGSGTTITNGTAGNNSTFGALTASGGSANSTSTPGAGGTCTGSLGTQDNSIGADGPGADSQATAFNAAGGQGASSFYGGAGRALPGAAGGAAQANSGSGGAGGGSNATAGVVPAPGGAAGCRIWTLITSPAASYSFAIGNTAAGASAGTSGFAGGTGAGGKAIITAYFQ